MAKVEHYYTRFEEGEFYHVYNRSVDKKPLFIHEGNNHFFLLKLAHFLKDVASIYAYCLLENHFHLLIKISDDLSAFRILHKVEDTISAHTIVSRQFRRFFQSYSLKFNFQQKRCGTLFQTPFKRSLVKNHQYLIHLIYYIHTNAQKHQLAEDFKNWEWSSYYHILSAEDEIIAQTILNWFGNKTGYINFHHPRVTDFDNL